MRKIILTLTIMTTISVYSQNNDSISKLITGMEKSALKRWNNGDPS